MNYEPLGEDPYPSSASVPTLDRQDKPRLWSEQEAADLEEARRQQERRPPTDLPPLSGDAEQIERCPSCSSPSRNLIGPRHGLPNASERCADSWHGPRPGDHRHAFWRTGRKVGRTLYAMVDPAAPSDDDSLIGMMDTTALAYAVVTAHNEWVKAQRRHPAGRPVRDNPQA